MRAPASPPPSSPPPTSAILAPHLSPRHPRPRGEDLRRGRPGTARGAGPADPRDKPEDDDGEGVCAPQPLLRRPRPHLSPRHPRPHPPPSSLPPPLPTSSSPLRRGSAAGATRAPLAEQARQILGTSPRMTEERLAEDGGGRGGGRRRTGERAGEDGERAGADGGEDGERAGARTGRGRGEDGERAGARTGRGRGEDGERAGARTTGRSWPEGPDGGKAGAASCPPATTLWAGVRQNPRDKLEDDGGEAWAKETDEGKAGAGKADEGKAGAAKPPLSRCGPERRSRPGRGASSVPPLPRPSGRGSRRCGCGNRGTWRRRH